MSSRAWSGMVRSPSPAAASSCATRPSLSSRPDKTLALLGAAQAAEAIVVVVAPRRRQRSRARGEHLLTSCVEPGQFGLDAGSANRARHRWTERIVLIADPLAWRSKPLHPE